MFNVARCINIIFNSLLAQLVKYDVYTARKIKFIPYTNDFQIFLYCTVLLSKFFFDIMTSFNAISVEKSGST